MTFLSVLLAQACRVDAPDPLRMLDPPPLPQETANETSQPDSPVVMNIDGMHFTAHEFLVAERVLRLLRDTAARRVPNDYWLQSAGNRRTVLRQVIHNRLLIREAQARGLSVSDDEALAELSRSLLSGLVTDTEARAARLAELPPLQWQDVVQAARLRLLKEQWTRVLAAETLTDDVLLELWTADQDRMRLAVVLVPNQPTPVEINAALQSRTDEIREWFNGHRGWFRQATTVDISFLPLDRPAEELAEIAVNLPAQPDAIPPDAGERVQRPVTERDLSSAFLHERGECFVAELEDQPGIACVESTPQTHYAQWDDPGTQYTASARVLELDGPLPGPLTEATVILNHWRDDSPEQFAAWLAEQGHEVQTTPYFSAASGGSIPLLGDVPQIHRILFELLDEDGEFVQQPFLTPHGIAAVQLLDRQIPDPVNFAAIRDAYLQEVQPRFEADAWERFLQRFIDTHSPEMDIEMLQQAEDAFQTP